jgi:hypothetical protein
MEAKDVARNSRTPIAVSVIPSKAGMISVTTYRAKKTGRFLILRRIMCAFTANLTGNESFCINKTISYQ